MSASLAIAGIMPMQPHAVQPPMPRVSLRTNAFWVGTRAPDEDTPAPPRVCELYSILREAHPRAVSIDRVIDRLWGAAPPTDPRNSLHFWLGQLRDTLAEFGWTVVRERGFVGGPDGLKLEPKRRAARRPSGTGRGR